MTNGESAPATLAPGYKSTEFWLTVLASIVSLAWASGIIGTGSSAEQFLGVLTTMISTFGYTVQRGAVKAKVSAPA